MICAAFFQEAVIKNKHSRCVLDASIGKTRKVTGIALSEKKEYTMSLKISFIDSQNVTGILDGSADFTLQHSEGKTVARIAGWEKELEDRTPGTIASMRCAAYEVIARYREHQRTVRPSYVGHRCTDFA
jgi:hypothetical protein